MTNATLTQRAASNGLLKAATNGHDLKIGDWVQISEASSDRLREGVEKSLGPAPYRFDDRKDFQGPDMSIAYIRGRDNKTIRLNVSHLTPYVPQNQQFPY